MARGFVVGLDFGTNSARALLLDADTGGELTVLVEPYRHGVIERMLPTGQMLADDWALQHPRDYLEVLESLLTRVAVSRSEFGELLGIGISFTSCTVLPTTDDGTPLLFLDKYAEHPHAFAKLWKHHAAEPFAQQINIRQPYFLAPYGDRTSPEWSLAKACEVIEFAPEIWASTRWWIDAGDWVVWSLVGDQVRSRSHAGCKNHWQPQWGGYPDRESLSSLGAGVETWLDTLAEPHPVGSCAGGLNPSWARRTGLPEGVPVAVSVVDAEAALPGTDVRRPGPLVFVMGTSSCQLTLSEKAQNITGVESIVDGGAIHGLYDYCTGQPATGDMLRWWTELIAGGPSDVGRRRDEMNAELALRRRPSSVTVMDWWNGCRTPLGEASLTGRMTGLRLTTSATDIYHGMVDATAFGARVAVELLSTACEIGEVRATGSLAHEPAIMQIYADVLGRDVRVSETRHGSARGAAYYGALAAGTEVPESLRFREYSPSTATDAYQDAYAAYRQHLKVANRVW